MSEKIDGSLGILYFYGGRWNVATRGAFDSEQALWAAQYLSVHINQSYLDSRVTYLCEILYKENRIVIRYPHEGLVLLCAYSLVSGEELSSDDLDTTAKLAGFKRPVSYTYNIDQMIDIAKNLSADAEGFVVRFENGYRVKIKGKEYCRLHRIISNITPLALWDSMLQCDEMLKIRIEIPEEYYEDFDAIHTLLLRRFDDLILKIKNAVRETEKLSDKETGLLLQSGTLDADAAKFLFAARKDNLVERAYIKGAIREKVFKSFRPDGNNLPGYVPTTSIRKFNREK